MRRHRPAWQFVAGAVGLAVLVNGLLYPAYTAGFTNELRGLLGNLATLALAAYVAGRLHSVTRLGSAMIGAVMAWALFATFATFRLPG